MIVDLAKADGGLDVAKTCYPLLSASLGMKKDQAKHCFALTQEKIYDFLSLSFEQFLLPRDHFKTIRPQLA